MEIKDLKKYLLNLKNIFEIALKRREELSDKDINYLRGELNITNEILRMIEREHQNND